jgi:hypothetical protein
MAGLRTWFGNPVSEQADRTLDLIGIGKLLAISTRRELNTLACVRYRPEFGKDQVYYLRNLSQEQGKGKADYALPLQAPRLFGEDVTHGLLEERLAAGWTIRSTRLTDAFGWRDFQAQYTQADATLLLFVRTERGSLRVAAVGRTLEPKPGDTVIALVDPAARRDEETPATPEAIAEAAAATPERSPPAPATAARAPTPH